MQLALQKGRNLTLTSRVCRMPRSLLAKGLMLLFIFEFNVTFSTCII